MTVLKITLADYRISPRHLALLAEEFYGKELTNDETAGSVELGFDGPDGPALSKLFQTTLDGFITAEARVRRDQKDPP